MDHLRLKEAVKKYAEKKYGKDNLATIEHLTNKTDSLVKAIDCVLTPKEKYVMTRRIYKGETLDNVARSMYKVWPTAKNGKFSREYVRQIEEKAMRKITRYIGKPDIVDERCSVSFLEFNQHATNQLENNGIKTVGDLIDNSFADLLYKKHIGPACINNIRSVLGEYGYKLRGE